MMSFVYDFYEKTERKSVRYHNGPGYKGDELRVCFLRSSWNSFHSVRLFKVAWRFPRGERGRGKGGGGVGQQELFQPERLREPDVNHPVIRRLVSLRISFCASSMHLSFVLSRNP